MPNLAKHCKFSFERYGVYGEEIHKWLDEPTKISTFNHRQFRHDTETIKLVATIFGKKYGKNLAEQIALDHVMLDHKEELKLEKIEPKEALQTSKPTQMPQKIEEETKPEEQPVAHGALDENALKKELEYPTSEQTINELAKVSETNPNEWFHSERDKRLYYVGFVVGMDYGRKQVVELVLPRVENMEAIATKALEKKPYDYGKPY